MNIFTAEADAWRTAMTRGQQSASAPRFPGRGNELFTAEGEAWRQSMTRGQVPVAAVADDHGGMTHKCDGCSDGAPCGSCGGNVSRTSPAYQALGWGMMQAYANGMTDPYWKAATVAHALRTAPGRTNSAEWNAIESMVDRTQALNTVGAQGMNAVGAMLPYWSSMPINSILDVNNDGVPDNLNRGIPYDVHGRQCCVLEFLYPVPTPTFSEKQIDGRKYWLGWEFEVLAVYNNGADGSGCSCDCCLFVQFVDGTTTTTPPAGQGNERNEVKHGQDCTEDGSGGFICYGDKNAALKYDPNDRSRSFEYYGSTGEFQVAGRPHIQPWIDAICEANGLTRDEVCIYYMVDYPGAEVGPGVHFSKSTCYTGMVLSTCPAFSIERSEDFQLKMSGTCEKLNQGYGPKKPNGERDYKRFPFLQRPESGKTTAKPFVTVKWDPDGEPKVEDKCS